MNKLISAFLRLYGCCRFDKSNSTAILQLAYQALGQHEGGSSTGGSGEGERCRDAADEENEDDGFLLKGPRRQRKWREWQRKRKRK